NSLHGRCHSLHASINDNCTKLFLRRRKLCGTPSEAGLQFWNRSFRPYDRLAPIVFTIPNGTRELSDDINSKIEFVAQISAVKLALDILNDVLVPSALHFDNHVDWFAESPFIFQRPRTHHQIDNYLSVFPDTSTDFPRP